MCLPKNKKTSRLDTIIKKQNSAEKHCEKAAEESSEEKEQNPVEDLQDENAKLKDQLLRTIAEFDNFRKRTNKEKAELILNGGRKAVTDILPILDDFERALSNETKRCNSNQRRHANDFQ